MLVFGRMSSVLIVLGTGGRSLPALWACEIEDAVCHQEQEMSGGNSHHSIHGSMEFWYIQLYIFHKNQRKCTKYIDPMVFAWAKTPLPFTHLQNPSRNCLSQRPLCL